MTTSPPILPSPPRTFPLQWALLGALVAALLAGLVPAAVALDRRLTRALTMRARADLALAPRVLAARVAARDDALRMHASVLARDTVLARALAHDDWRGVERALGDALLHAPSAGAPPIVLRGAGMAGGVADWPPAAAAGLLGRTRRGELSVAVLPGGDGTSLRTVALAPVLDVGRWVGAAGYVVALDSIEATTLGALTRSAVVILATAGTTAVAAASTLPAAETAAVREAVASSAGAFGDEVHDVNAGGQRYFVVAGRLGGSGAVLFARRADRELAVLGDLRRGELLAALAAFGGTLVAGAVVAHRLARPVRTLAAAADATARGDFAAPLPQSRIAEVDRVSGAFGQMRAVLDARLRELEASNDALAERSARLATLQTELIQRDRLAAAGRLVAQLAHEIRNPVASLRNCLELLRRAVADQPEAVEFADLAIDELLRMHELAEQMLDVHRPRASAEPDACCAAVARDVATLANLGAGPAVVVELAPAVSSDLRAAIPGDTLKQVLLNVVQNAREAMAPNGDGAAIVLRVEHPGPIALTVIDEGSGIPAAALPRLFDPFFTTKQQARGVGLGLFVAEGLVRGAGGRLTAGNRPAAGEPPSARRGAWFRIELPPTVAEGDA